MSEENNKSIKDEYLKLIKERQEEGRVTKSYQLTGLNLAKILEDEEHKSLYIKLAKQHEKSFLIDLAKNVADRPNVENKGAYFMKLLQKKKGDDNT
ncbi:MAG: hypothetical protein ABEI53_02125 [Candidatus Magasanikbacteria bacterium]